MNKHFEKRSDEMAKDYSVNDNWATQECGYDRDRRHFKAGFNTCYAEMAPLVEALKKIAESFATLPIAETLTKEQMFEWGVYRGQVAREALKKIGVE